MRILITSAYGYWGNFNPSDLRDPKSTVQVGGGETAMTNIARELAALGQEVFVFYDVGRPGNYDGVEWLPRSLFVPLATQLEHDVLVSWDDPHAFRYCDRAKAHVLAFQLNATYVTVFDAVIDRYFHPSQWHADRYLGLYPEITKAKQRARITNGVDPLRYTQVVPRDPNRVVYSSSPDRGLHHLLDIWPDVKRRVPLASLHVFYDKDKWLATTKQLVDAGYYMNTADVATQVEQGIKAVEGLDVEFHGGIGQWQLAAEQLKSGLMVYPCDPVQPTEGFSMSCLEGITAGCTLITSSADALGELWTDTPGTIVLPLPIDKGVWVDAIVRELGKNSHEPRIPEHYMWKTLARQWQGEFEACLQTQ